jgi:hypothetical protein
MEVAHWSSGGLVPAAPPVYTCNICGFHWSHLSTNLHPHKNVFISFLIFVNILPDCIIYKLLNHIPMNQYNFVYLQTLTPMSSNDSIVRCLFLKVLLENLSLKWGYMHQRIQNLDLCSMLGALSKDISLSCQTCCDMGPQFFRSCWVYKNQRALRTIPKIRITLPCITNEKGNQSTHKL